MKQSQTGGTQTRGYFRLIKSADGEPDTGATGKAKISKNGADAVDTTNDIVEIDATDQPGMYYVELTATELNTLGHVIVTKDTANSWPGGFTAIVVPDDVFTAAATANDIATAILDLADGIETGYTLRYAIRLMASALAGKSSNDGKTYRDLADGRDAITATVDASGNRTAVTHDPTP
jgi:hypothetical protein